MPRYKIKELIEDKLIDNRFLLPTFQRDYVWTEAQIETLFDSLMRKLPVSSLLLWQLAGSEILKKDFPFRFLQFCAHFDSFPNTRQAQVVAERDYHGVIDGQQRLTSIFIGFKGSYRIWNLYARRQANSQSYRTDYLYLGLRELTTESKEEKQFDFRFLPDTLVCPTPASGEKSAPRDVVEQDGTKYLRVGAVCDLTDSKLKRKFMERWEMTDTERDLTEDLIDLYQQHEIDCLEWKGEADDAVSVFVRYNSKGKVLSQGDIILALLMTYWPDASEEIKKLRTDIGKTGFQVSVPFIIKALLTVYTDNPKNNLRSINQSSATLFRNHWKRFRTTLDNLFRDLDKAGFSPRTLTSHNALLPILYFRIHNDVDPTSLRSVRNSEMQWLRRTLLTGAFSGQSDRTIASSIKPMRAGEKTSHSAAANAARPEAKSFPADEINERIREFSQPIDIAGLLKTRKDDREAPLLLSLLFPTEWDCTTSELDHLHPISAFTKKDPDYERADSIVNLQPLHGKANGRKNATPLDAWVLQAFPDLQERTEYLDGMLIGPAASLDFKDRERLWDSREKLMAYKLERLLDR